MNFDFYYGVITFIEGVVIMAAVFLLLSKLHRNPVVFLSSFYNKKYKKYAFVMFFISVAILAVNYGITTFISLSNPATLFWEYGNVVTFGFLAVFFIMMAD